MSEPAAFDELVAAARVAKGVLERVHLNQHYSGELTLNICRLDRVLARCEPLSAGALSSGELAERWGVSASTVRGYIEDGKLAAFDVGRGTVKRWRVTAPEALRFVAQRQNRALSMSAAAQVDRNRATRRDRPK
jgi:hypothetical protein